MQQISSLVCDALGDVKVTAIDISLIMLPRIGILATQYPTSKLPSHVSISESAYAEPMTVDWIDFAKDFILPRAKIC